MQFPKTPIQQVSVSCDNTIYMKRDDLLPYSFGGNKVRIAFRFYEDMRRKQCDCMIGYGNSRSNLCRVMANIGREHFYMIQPEDVNGGFHTSSNSQLVDFFGAKIISCSREKIADTIQNTMEQIIAAGNKPYYMNGNKYGAGNEVVPVGAYVDVFQEIIRQERELNIHFDFIAVAAGTCMTLSGLVCGKNCYAPDSDVRIVGFATAHDAQRGYQNIRKYSEAYAKDKNIDYENVIYDDSCLCGGYAQANDDIYQVISDMLKENGIALDPTYTGKAFWGLQNYLLKNNIKNKNILFIHTGGTPLFFDSLRDKRLK